MARRTATCLSTCLAALALAALPLSAAAQDRPPSDPTAGQDRIPHLPPPPLPRPAPPQLIVAIAVDQLSADLFTEYRPHFTGGLKRLAEGAVFPQAYQAHAATETCPGHATILTGVHPGRSGIIANNYFNLANPRADKRVYCVEDDSLPGTASGAGRYVPSLARLRVPTLGDRLKAADPAAQVVSVAGKDRAALLMGGRRADAVWWLAPVTGLASLPGVAPTGVAKALADEVVRRVSGATPAQALPAPCAARSHPVMVRAGDGDWRTVGTGRFARPALASDADAAARTRALRAFAASPEADAAVLALAAGLRAERKLGERPRRAGHMPDLLSIGLSATDYVGHAYGTGGAEMCGQLLALDRDLGAFFKTLDGTGIDYLVMLTADHGGHDLPERNRALAMPDAARADAALDAPALNTALAAELGLDPKVTGPLVYSDGPFGDFYLSTSLPAATRARVAAAFQRRVAAHPQVERLFTKAELAAMPRPGREPERWSLAERVRAGFDPERSGDFVLMLKPRITQIPEPGVGYVATHGSAHDYDRRVPLLFWRRGMTGFEQPNPVMVVDVVPTLAGMARLPLEPGASDGRCLDLSGQGGESCSPAP